MCGPFSTGVLDVRFFILLLSVIVYRGYGIEEQNRKTYVVRYKYEDSTIPVTVVLDYKKQVEYVINMNPRTPTKSVTFYDFKQKSIAYKDMTNKECFLSQLTYENLQEENEILESLQNPVESKPLLLTLDSTRLSLTPTQIRNLAGQKIAMFCRKMATWRLQENHSQKRSRREVHSGHQLGSNNQERGEFRPYDQEIHQPGYSTPSSNTHRKRKAKQTQRRSRNILTSTATDSHPNVYHRQTFHQHLGSDSSNRTPENSHRKNTQQNSQNYNRINGRRSHHQNVNTSPHLRFQNNLYPRSQPYYNNFNIEDKTSDASRYLESSVLASPRQPPSYDPSSFNRPLYKLPDVEPRHRFHHLVFNESSEEILEHWSHPLRIPKRKIQLPITHQTLDSRYDSDRNSVPYDHFQGYVQPLHRPKPGVNNFKNEWFLPLRYNSSNNEHASFFPDSEKPLLNSDILKQEYPTGHLSKNNSLHEFAYVTLNDSDVEENRPVYQTLFYDTKTQEEPTPIPAMSLNFREIEKEGNSPEINRTFESNFNTSTPEDFKDLIIGETTQEKVDKAQIGKEALSLHTDENFVLINYSQNKSSSSSDEDFVRHHVQLGQQNGTSDYHPKRQERLQNALTLFTPDEIVIDIGKYPTENPITHTPSFSDYPSATHRPRIVESPTRTLQYQGKDKPILRPPSSNSYQHPSKDRFVNKIPGRNIHVANPNAIQPQYNFPRVTVQQPQHTPAVLPPGFAIYPRHPKAPYARFASPNTQRTIPSLRIPNNRYVPKQHHQRHHHKRQNNPCCSMQNTSPRSSNCCTSRRSCCTRHRGQYSNSCCSKANESRKNPKPVASTTEEKAPADQQYSAPEVANSKTFCEKQKMCRTLYQSTKAVMLCRNGHVPGC